MVKAAPKPAGASFDPTQADVRAMLALARIRQPSADICEKIADDLGAMGRGLTQRLYHADQPEPLISQQHRAFWQAMDLLDFSLPGLHPLYGLIRVHIPGGQKNPVSGDDAFVSLMGAMMAAGKFVPRAISEQRLGFDATELALRLLAMYQHYLIPPGSKLTMSSGGPAVRFVQLALQKISGVAISEGAVYQRLLDARQSAEAKQ